MTVRDIRATYVTDAVFIVSPLCATAIAIWGNNIISGEQLVGIFTLCIGYAAGRPVSNSA